MVQLILEYTTASGSVQRHELEVEPSDGDAVEMLRFQVYSLTDVPPEEQELIGLGAGVLADSANLSSLGLQNGHKVILRRKAHAPAAAPAAPAAPRSAGPSLVSVSALDLEGTCTRSFLGASPSAQPGALAFGGAPVCVGCATSCFLPGQVRPRPSVAEFACACAETTDSGHFCVYSGFGSGSAVHGAFLDELRAQLRAQAVEFQRSMTAASSKQMAARLVSYAKSVDIYEDASLHAEALKVIPVDTLKSRAATRIAERAKEVARYSAEAKGSEQDNHSGRPVGPPRPLSAEDALLLELLNWFKHEFFAWVNAPKCDSCGADTQNAGGSAATPEEVHYGARVVELYRCAQGHVTRFPRYNHPGKLLQTRRGRCGEWCQAFTLCCRALGFETRVVYDWTDHVWNEVYSAAEQRWMHADSCENARDAPLLYEKGWGKKLNYCVAFSAEECLDVTKRYTRKWNEVLSRRLECPEPFLEAQISALSRVRSSRQPAARQAVLAARRVLEQRELDEPHGLLVDAAALAPNAPSAAPAPDNPDEMKGRTTGSVEWRLARGELGATPAAAAAALKATEAPVTVPPSQPAPSLPAAARDATSPPLPSNAPSAPAPTPAAPVHPEAPQVQDPKALAKELFNKYFTQLTVGCGKAECPNPMCKSHPGFAVKQSEKSQAAALAIQLMSKHKSAMLCSHYQAPQ